MPSYFYHLTFELYPTAKPGSDTGGDSSAPSASRKGAPTDERSKKSATEKGASISKDSASFWLPPPGTDIFGDLPESGISRGEGKGSGGVFERGELPREAGFGGEIEVLRSDSLEGIEIPRPIPLDDIERNTTGLIEDIGRSRPVSLDSGSNSGSAIIDCGDSSGTTRQQKQQQQQQSQRAEKEKRKFEIISEKRYKERERRGSLDLPPGSTAALRPGVASCDWRFGRVDVESVDLMANNTPNNHKGGGDGNQRCGGDGNEKNGGSNGSSNSSSMGNAGGNPSAAPSLGPDGVGGGGNKAECLVVRRKNTEVGWGVVHFYREGEEAVFPDENDEADTDDDDDDDDDDGDGKQDEEYHNMENGEKKRRKKRRDEEYTTLCIPAVPAYMSAGDFLGFLGERWRGDISHCRLVRTGKMNRYLALLRFREGSRARVWRREFDGKIFNTMEICHAVFVRKITFATPTGTDSREHPSSKHVSSTLKPFPPPTPHLIELPTCPVCLERMDETNGLMTIPCSHVFHCTCLQNWKGAGCPVCRSTTHASSSGSSSSGGGTERDPSNPFTQPFGSGPVTNMCSVCDDTDDLWICLICGYQGCGRYNGGHLKDHWKETAHSFALEVQSQHVWDYAGDVWVHRLIRDKGDGKVVELPGRDMRGNAQGGEEEDVVPRAKLDAVALEYTHLMTSQLSTQGTYYEEMIRKARDKAAKADAELSRARREAEEALSKLKLLEGELSSDKATREELQSDLTRTAAKAGKSETLARSLSKSLLEEKQVSKGLMERISHLQGAEEKRGKELEEVRREVEELKEMNRDLSMFISGGERLKAMEEEGVVGEGEVEGGSLSVGRKGKGKGRRR